MILWQFFKNENKNATKKSSLAKAKKKAEEERKEKIEKANKEADKYIQYRYFDNEKFVASDKKLHDKFVGATKTKTAFRTSHPFKGFKGTEGGTRAREILPT